jgi:hypothetical protein
MGMFCIVHECQCSVLVGAYLYNSGSVFYDAFSETRLYSVDDWVTSEWLWRIGEENIHALRGIRTNVLSVQAAKSDASDRGRWDRPFISYVINKLFIFYLKSHLK